LCPESGPVFEDLSEGEPIMKTWTVVILIVFLVLFVAVTTAPGFAVQKSSSSADVPKYDPATEATYKGVVEDVKDYVCPVSGGMGSHLTLKLADGKTIEVHVATTQFLKAYEFIFKSGDQVEVTGSKVKFQGVDTIFAREIKRGNEIMVLRDKEGKPAW
jgi:DNA/RNA endonuclease YhcR with UshA esterase domain